MRIALFAASALLTLIAAASGPAQAQRGVSYPVYPWCADYGGSRGGGTNCYFSNLWQCRQAASGNGGICYENPFYGYAGYKADVPASPRKQRRN